MFIPVECSAGLRAISDQVQRRDDLVKEKGMLSGQERDIQGKLEEQEARISACEQKAVRIFSVSALLGLLVLYRLATCICHTSI